MSSDVGPYGLRSRKTQPKGLINHFDLTEIAEVNAQANEYNAFKQAIQAAKSKNKVSRITSITLPIPRVAESGVLPPRPQLQELSHIMIPLSDIRSKFLNPEAIADNHAYWDTLNIPVFNQDRTKSRKSSVHPTTQPTTKRRITEILAVTSPTSPQLRRRTQTPATVSPSPTPSSGSELSSVDESILADTPEAFQDTASTAFTSAPSPTPKARRPRPRQPRGPRLGFFVEPANAEAPLFDYRAAACALREHKLRIEREAAIRRRHSELRFTILKAVKGVLQTPVEATALAVNREDGEVPQAREQTTTRATDQQGVDITQAPNQGTTTTNDHEDKDTSQANDQATIQETNREDGEDASSYGDPMDIDGLDTAGATQPLRLMIPQSENPRARQLLRASATRIVPPLRRHQLA